MCPLALLYSGEEAEIIKFVDSRRLQKQGSQRASARFISHLEEIGVRPGKKLEILINYGNGPVLVKVDNSRLAIGRNMAMKILVRRISNESS